MWEFEGVIDWLPESLHYQSKINLIGRLNDLFQDFQRSNGMVVLRDKMNYWPQKLLYHQHVILWRLGSVLGVSCTSKTKTSVRKPKWTEQLSEATDNKVSWECSNSHVSFRNRNVTFVFFVVVVVWITDGNATLSAYGGVGGGGILHFLASLWFRHYLFNSFLDVRWNVSTIDRVLHSLYCMNSSSYSHCSSHVNCACRSCQITI